MSNVPKITRSINNRNGQRLIVSHHDVANPKATAIVQNGAFGAFSRNATELMTVAFNALNINVVIPSRALTAQNDLSDMSLTSHCEDLEDAIKNTVDRGGVSGPLMIAGHSAGAYSTLLASAQLRGQYKPDFVLASAPLISGADHIQRRLQDPRMQKPAEQKWTEFMMMGGIFNPFAMQAFSDTSPKTARLEADFNQHNLIDHQIRPSMPAAFIVGAQDIVTSPSSVTEYTEQLQLGEPIILSEAGHSYNGKEHQFIETVKGVTGQHFH